MMRLESGCFSARRLSSVAAAALAFALVGVTTPAQAAFTTYFGIDQGNGSPPTTPVDSLAARNSFVGALTGVGVENFESQTVNAFPTTLGFAPTGITATATTGDSSNNFVTTGTSFGTFATSGTQYLFSPGDGTVGLNVSMTFSSAVAGFGLYVDDLGDGISPADQVQLILTLSDGSTQTFSTDVSGNNNNANLLFFGVVSSDPSLKITGVEIQNTNTTGGDAIGIDDLTIGTAAAVPEPSSVALLGIGAVGVVVGYVRRRRKPSRLA